MLLLATHFLCLIVNCLPRHPAVEIQNIQNAETLVSNTRYGRTSLPYDLVNNIPLSSGEPPRVKTASGWVEGYFQKTITGRTIAAFEGIPYAKSPSGERRFRKPEAVDPWEGMHKAISRPPSCLQIDFSQAFRIHGVENCLFLSVYTPSPHNESNLPVIVFIHGGGFESMTSSDYGPAFYLDSNIVLVTFNYRLGVLGFLSTGDDASSGNWAMKDQVLALKWVRQNIRNFGGNPSLITLQGESAGAVSVGLHLVSNMSRGLFHRAICQSGSSLIHWGVQNDTIAHSKLVAQGMNCPTDDSYAMVNCLRESDPNWVVAKMGRVWKHLVTFRFPFGPVIEHLSAEEPFLVEAPEVTYLKGQVPPVPMIIGVNRDEGAAFAAVAYLTPLMIGSFNRNFTDLASYGLAYEKRTNNLEEVSNKIRQFYLQGQRMTFWNRKGWTQMIGDRTIMQGTYYGMQYHSTVAPTYGYVFNFLDKMSIVNMGGLETKDWGVSHADELQYFFNFTLISPLKIDSRGYQMSKFLINLWTNFARTGKPVHIDEEGTKTEFWDVIKDPRNIQVLDINTDAKMTPMPFQDRLKFWRSLKLKDDPYEIPRSKFTRDLTIDNL